MVGRERLMRMKEVLTRACISGAPFDRQTRYYPGHEMMPTSTTPAWAKYGYHPIAGRFGLVMVLKSMPVVVAHMGFDLEDDTLKITNSPQGLSRECSYFSSQPPEVKRLILERLRKNSFREKLLESLLKIGESLSQAGIIKIRAVPAEYDLRVNLNGGSLPYEEALKSMDYLYTSFGFSRNEDEEYTLSLRR